MILVTVTQPVSEEMVLLACLNPNLFRDPELAQLARELLHILVQDRAPQTVKTYIRSYRAWKKWAEKRKIISLPADIMSFALYLVSIMQQA